MTLEENIRLGQRLFAQEENENRRKAIQELVTLLTARLEEQKAHLQQNDSPKNMSDLNYRS